METLTIKFTDAILFGYPALKCTLIPSDETKAWQNCMLNDETYHLTTEANGIEGWDYQQCKSKLFEWADERMKAMYQEEAVKIDVLPDAHLQFADPKNIKEWLRAKDAGELKTVSCKGANDLRDALAETEAQLKREYRAKQNTTDDA